MMSNEDWKERLEDAWINSKALRWTVVLVLTIIFLLGLSACSTPVLIKPDPELAKDCKEVPVPDPLTIRSLIGYGVQQQESIKECSCRMAALRGEVCK